MIGFGQSENLILKNFNLETTEVCGSIFQEGYSFLSHLIVFWKLGMIGLILGFLHHDGLDVQE